MALGSSKARELFPRLLQLVEQYPDTMELMIKKVKKVPSIRPYVHTTRNLITAPSSFFFLFLFTLRAQAYLVGCSLVGSIK